MKDRFNGMLNHPIEARCRYRYMADMTAAIADMVVDEETGIGKQLITAITGLLTEDSGGKL